ncbi:MAG TPA: DUF1697 domain-containing protein [Thermoanaerobaculia bacterium]|jgi:uncharacterized protein (DUF1697 family)|nr:DUF1697 domain-containing protein [Thermoanaerobaculia bacterium]
MSSGQPFICLIRGVNVGGNKLLKMDALRSLCDAIGLKGAKTYLQSGNVVFCSSLDRKVLAKRIEDGIRKATGFEAKVILRTASEMRAVIAANPFTAGPQRNPKAFLVAFLDGEIGKEARALLMKLKIDSEELHFGDRELYLYLPDGIAGSKLSNALTEKKLGVNVTARNWNTVNALLEMAEEGR